MITLDNVIVARQSQLFGRLRDARQQPLNDGYGIEPTGELVQSWSGG